MYKPVVLVTGCGSGIGLELAKLLYSDSTVRTVVTARAHRLPTLHELFPNKRDFKIVELDITNDENIYHLVNTVCREWGRLDVVVNNAAVCYRGVVEHMDSEAEQAQLKTNYLGPMTLVRAVLPIMREQRRGQIINVSSASGLMAMPTMGSYSASKHALKGATEALWYEARPFGIHVHLVEIGFVNSRSFQNVRLSKKAKISQLVNGPHSEYYWTMTPFIERLMKLSPTSAERVAARIARVIEKKPSRLRILATYDVFLYDLLQRILPTRFFHRVLYAILPGSVKWGKDAAKNRMKRRPPPEPTDFAGPGSQYYL